MKKVASIFPGNQTLSTHLAVEPTDLTVPVIEPAEINTGIMAIVAINLIFIECAALSIKSS